MTDPKPAPTLVDAAERLADLFRSTDTAYEVGPTLQCTEADAIADLLRAAGHTNSATSGSTPTQPRTTKATSTTPRHGRRKA